MKVKTPLGNLPVRYGMNALRKIADDYGISMNEVMQLDLNSRKMGEVFQFVYHGFLEGARLEGEECKVKSLDDVGDILQDDMKILEKCVEQFVEDMPQANGEEVKKK